MKKGGLALLLYAAAMLTSSHAWADCKLSPKDIQGEIDKAGAKQALQNSYADGNRWYLIMQCVATGDQRWLDIAVELAPYSDAATSEDLNIYLGKAIATNAEGVLRLKVPEWLSEACGWLDNDLPPDMNNVQLDRWYLQDINARLAGLKRIHSADLADAAAKCKAEIDEDLTSLNADLARDSGQKSPP